MKRAPQVEEETPSKRWRGSLGASGGMDTGTGPSCGFEKFALELGAPKEMTPWRRDAEKRRQEISPQEWREDLVLKRIYRKMQNIAKSEKKERQALDSVVDGYEQMGRVSAGGDTRGRVEKRRL